MLIFKILVHKVFELKELQFRKILITIVKIILNIPEDYSRKNNKHKLYSGKH